MRLSLERRGMIRDEIDRIGVVGAGTMGSGIAQVAATGGYDVVMRDIDREYVDDGFETIEDSLDRLAERDALPDDPQTIRGRIEGTTDLADLAECDVVIEAALEKLDVKRDIFADLE